jgi:two-component system C4-dicarboxylate transport sensor histidine kinase DctB
MTLSSGPSSKNRPRLLRAAPLTWRLRVALAVLALLAVATIGVTNRALTHQFAEADRNRAALRLALYSGNLMSELRRNAVVPQLLANDATLIGALNSGDFSQSSQRLISFVEEIGSASLMLLDMDGRTMASTDRNRLGGLHRNDGYFVDALRSNNTVFRAISREGPGFVFAYSRKIEFQNQAIGVIVVEVDLQKFEFAWAGIADAVLVSDSEGTIILSTENRWRGLNEAEALRRAPADRAIDRAIQLTSDWAVLPPDAYLGREGVMRTEARVPFRGWRIVSFSTYSGVRERVNTVLALEIMGFAILAALLFYGLSRKTALRMALFQRESADLRELNMRLQREIAERERMQQSLAVAEQSLAQSSKLAALGEMSAAVSHELNQPLAAMKTYLAGARLLLQRSRSEEAMVAFLRIDDLIERMGAITKQLKSYARKGADELHPVDMAAAVTSSISMMEPQLKSRRVQMNCMLPEDPVVVLGDRMRLEQVIINLLRNALDATRNVATPTIDMILASGETVSLTVRDNGDGVEDLSALFEPFYTTKQPGDGVGLGLAISSGIVTDHGGRLRARNGEQGGAVFEMQLPLLEADTDVSSGAPFVASSSTQTTAAK